MGELLFIFCWNRQQTPSNSAVSGVGVLSIGGVLVVGVRGRCRKMGESGDWSASAGLGLSDR